MKKFAVVLALFIGVVGVSFADNGGTANLDLSATISKYSTVSIAPAAAASWELLQTGRVATKVGVATFNTNFNNWIVKVHSDHGSKLVRQSDTSDYATPFTDEQSDAADPATAEVTSSIPYTFAFEKTSGAHEWPDTYISLLSTPPLSSTDLGYYTQKKKTVKAGEPVDMKIDIVENTAATLYWDAGIYTDTIHVSILAL